MSINSVILTGRLSADPDIKATSQSTLVANFSIAVSEFYKGEEHTSFFNCIAFGKTAEIVQQYIKKGSLVGIDGSLRQSRWEDNDGNKRNKVEVIVNRVEMLGAKRDDNNNSGSSYTKSENTSKDSKNNSFYESNEADFIEDENDIPF